MKMVILSFLYCEEFVKTSIAQTGADKISLSAQYPLSYPIFLVYPRRCGNRCECYFVQDVGNTQNCSSRNLTSLPPNKEVPNITDYLNLSKNNINILDGNQRYFRTIYGLMLSNNTISNITDKFLENLGNGKIEVLDLRNNFLKRLPHKITSLSTLREIWLRNNPFVCDCDMLWMKDWMETFNKSDNMVVKDYYTLQCKNGLGPIYDLDPVKMGCFPRELTLWEKILIGLSVVIVIAIVIAIIAISRRWDEVKWFMYLHFNILDTSDGKEDLSCVENDALISYR